MPSPTPWSQTDIPPLAGQTVLVTGANRGLGLVLASQFAMHGAHVVVAGRDMAKLALAVASIRNGAPRADVEPMSIDMADLASIRRFADKFAATHGKLDVLCHNAAAIMVPHGRTVDGFESHIGTNHLGPFALTGLLLDSLRAAPAARIVSTGSLAHRMSSGLDLDDSDYARRRYKEMDAYGASKIAALSFTFELDRRLRRAQLPIRAVAAHPGYTATNTDLGNAFIRLSTKLFAQSPAIGALPMLYAATAPDVRSGEYFGPSGFKELRGAPRRVQASETASDATLGARLWNWSQAATGVHYLDAATSPA
ncbi:oxidoreductase [Solimonas marina]|uniref:SDR family NAD(P)-dependent oxidoreductase n=1 Tax=Solimonas marina TaxID=2714601 RepID=A0A969WE38_9GAMM|nr:oxidoreductase [Solimonas marina]NKF23686.1 SDR family NAD(P)-dependent oxidoreductase [Solimonas marina]